MYGVMEYGAVKYAQEQTVTEDEPNIYKPDLLSYITPVLRDIEEFKVINDIISNELSLLSCNIRDIFKQCFIDTATWGLTFWENQYGILIDLSKSYEERREIIKAKKRGQGTVNGKLLKSTAEAFSGGEVQIINHPESYYFIVEFIGIKGIPRNIASFKDMLDTIKPAHLAYEFQYTYTWWDKLNELTWNSAKFRTWNDLKVFE